jgi:hypothetical protein
MMASGCIVTTGSDTYESCDFDSDCNDLVDSCVSVSVDSGGVTFSNAICTSGCTADSACPISNNGNPGICENLDRGFLCYESCDFDFDCDPGFACYPLDVGGSICLPG